MRYSTYAFYLDRIGSDLGSEEKWTSYCMRRGNANAILGVAPDSVVDQVMRHDPMTGCLANAYLNRRVGFNTQDAYLERDPSADGLTRAFTHMGIRCNPEVLKEIPKSELDKLMPDAEVVELRGRIKKMAVMIRQEHGFIKSAPKKQREDYLQLRQDLRKAEKAFKTDMTKAYQEACRRCVHNEELERQLNGMAASEDTAEPVIQHQLLERKLVQEIMCDFNLKLSCEDLTNRKIQAVDGLVLLASCREVRHARTLLPSPSPCPKRLDRETSTPCELPPKPAEIPLVLEKRQCIYCVGDEQLSYADRMRTFSRVSHMMDHVEKVYLRHGPKGRFVCRHPQCKHLGNFLTTLSHFKNHVQRVHGVKLRA